MLYWKCGQKRTTTDTSKEKHEILKQRHHEVLEVWPGANADAKKKCCIGSVAEDRDRQSEELKWGPSRTSSCFIIYINVATPLLTRAVRLVP